MTVEKLAEKAGISQPYLTRIEGGKRGLSVPLAERIAMALGEDVPTVLGLNEGNGVARPAVGFSDDAEPYRAQDDEILQHFAKKRRNVVPYKITSNALDQADIHAGDVVFLDLNAEAVEAVKPLQAVIAQVYSSEDLLKATTILRQFVPPSLLITNSSGENLPPLNIATEDVHIKGVIIATHRSLRVK